MQILFRTRHPEAALMRDAVERRVRFAFRRLNALVPRAEIKLDDINGPRGGPDKRCQIALRTDGAGAVVVSSVAKDWRCALDEALASAARLLLRTWRRSSTPRRQRRGDGVVGVEGQGSATAHLP
ncbi:HPF/RaiA family ribosome-associated protein [Acidovorax delafieldii]|uniref:HPF/RaiA family ribosome-associated protein n=1 Tax=Acidovorax delafieldii TaxID=47920 RepID=UPI003ECF7826